MNIIELPFGPGCYVARRPSDQRVEYVGRTNNLLLRLTSHYRRSQWWGDPPPIIEWHPCSTEHEAKILEIQLITELAPFWNVAHNGARP